MENDTIDIDLHLHHETLRAVLVSETGDESDAVWLPLSQIEIVSEAKFLCVRMPEWLAIDKGFL